MTDRYESPLSSRYASEYMLHLFSQDVRYQTWRKLWVSLARAEHKLGLGITEEQVKELEAHITDIDYAVAAEREKLVRHDVMAHVYAYGQVAPSAAGISARKPKGSFTWARPPAMSRTMPISSSTGMACAT